MVSQPSHARAGRFARFLLAVRRWLSSGWIRPNAYRPEKHYMRGPGPKSRGRDGDHAQSNAR